MFIISIALFVLSAASLFGVLYLVLRKAPVLVQIREESLASRETFFAFLSRITRTAFVSFRPRRIKMQLLAQLARLLNAARVFFSKIHHVLDAMAKTAREKSQKMDWEHRWFTPTEVKREEKDDRADT